MDNPFLSPSTVPAFENIKPAHYMPAIDQAIANIERKVEQLKTSTAPADFQNTVIPLENLFEEVSYILGILGNCTSNAYTKELADIEEEAAIKVSDLQNAIFQDPMLGARFRSVYEKRDQMQLDEDDAAILRDIHNSFEDSGALLPPEGQQKIRDITTKLISLSQAFKDNLQNAPLQQAVLITNPAELAGLSTEEIEGLAENARKNGHSQGWLFIPERLMVDDLLERAESSSFREKISKALNRMGKEPPYDNHAIIKEMQVERHAYATLLGYEHYAAYARARAMKTSLPDVKKFLTETGEKALAQFEEDMRSLEKFSAQNGGPAKLEPWDVAYWATRQREALYQFDANGFAKYLELENVLQGMFNEAAHLFNIDLRETKKYSVIHPDIRTYDVLDKTTGEMIGILHVDMFARPGAKHGGAWMNEIQRKSGDQPPVIILNMNIPKPPEGKPALVGLSQYITLYHEMGHSLHGLLGTHTKYKSLQGPAASADFVEIHSMLNEHRALLKKNLQTYALHVDSGKPASDATIDALIQSNTHFASREILKVVQNSLRDITFHSIDPATYSGDEALEESVKIKSPYADHFRPYPLTRFTHLFDDAHSGYAAGYVNYLIAQEYSADGFEPFEKDPYNAKLAEKLHNFYKRGSGGDPAQLYRDYRGRDAVPDAMLRNAGITDHPKKVPIPAPPKKQP